MNDIFSYIFNRLKAADVDLKNINRALRAQSTLNCIFAGVTLYALARMKQQRDEIEELTEKVEELKEKKGE